MKRHINLYYILRINTNSSSNLKNVKNQNVFAKDVRICYHRSRGVIVW